MASSTRGFARCARRRAHSPHPRHLTRTARLPGRENSGDDATRRLRWGSRAARMSARFSEPAAVASAAGTELLAELLQLVLEAPDADAEPSGRLGAVAP